MEDRPFRTSPNC